MKQVFIILMLLTFVSVTNAQKRGKANKDMPFIDDAKPDTRTEYFIGIIPKNDTVKLAEFLATGIKINSRAEEAGADGSYYRTILTYAIINANINTVEFLLIHGADPNLRIRTHFTGMFNSNVHDEFSFYPLEVAATEGDLAKMDLLVRYGAEVMRAVEGLKEIATSKRRIDLMDWISNKTGMSAVQRNSLAVMTGYAYGYDLDASVVTVETIKQLIKGGADLNTFSPLGKTALINVIQNPKIKERYTLAKTLLQNGANPNLSDRVADDNKGMVRYYPVSPLKAAIEMNDLQMVKLLVESGANINQADDDYTPLKTAKSDDIKEYLILKGAKN